MISRNLSTLTDVFLFSSIANFFFPSDHELLEDPSLLGFHVVAYGPDAKSQLNLRGDKEAEGLAKLLIDFARLYVLEGGKEDIPNRWMSTRPSSTVSSIGADLHVAAQDFVLLHEYSHILLRHADVEASVEQEVEADTLAINALLLGSNSASDAKSTAIQAAGVLILVLFLTLCEEVRGVGPASKHPPSWLRFKYIYRLVRRILTPAALRRLDRVLNGAAGVMKRAADSLGAVHLRALSVGGSNEWALSYAEVQRLAGVAFYAGIEEPRILGASEL